MAMISVPPVLPPWLKTIPTPTPARIPPITADMKFSVTIGSLIIPCSTERNTDKTVVAKIVFMPNPFPSILMLDRIKTAFMAR